MPERNLKPVNLTLLVILQSNDADKAARLLHELSEMNLAWELQFDPKAEKPYQFSVRKLSPVDGYDYTSIITEVAIEVARRFGWLRREAPNAPLP